MADKQRNIFLYTEFKVEAECAHPESLSCVGILSLGFYIKREGKDDFFLIIRLF